MIRAVCRKESKWTFLVHRINNLRCSFLCLVSRPFLEYLLLKNCQWIKILLQVVNDVEQTVKSTRSSFNYLLYIGLQKTWLKWSAETTLLWAFIHILKESLVCKWKAIQMSLSQVVISRHLDKNYLMPVLLFAAIYTMFVWTFYSNGKVVKYICTRYSTHW